jgi:tetratricopeptide (TPR) repeat protein
MIGRLIFAGLCALALAVPALAEETPAPPAPEAAAPQAPIAAAPADDASLDALYARLAKAKDSDEADGIVARIDRLDRRSGSDTDDLLLARAAAALEGEKSDVALQLLDTVVALNPGWAEAWSLRGDAQFGAGQTNAAMIDLGRALADDPRHLRALANLGAMMENAGRREDALKVYERGLEIAPLWTPLREAAERVRAALAGQAL